MLIDLSTKKGKNLAYRLRLEDVIWVVVQRADAAPYPTPVWFVWEEKQDSIIIYSRANAKKLSHIQQYSKVSLHFNSSFRGDEIAIFTETTTIDDTILPVIDNAAYIIKYGHQFKAILNMSAEQYSDNFSVAYRVRLETMRAFN